MIAWLDRRFPRLAFARRVPPSRVVNRLRRRLEQRLGVASRLAVPRAALRPVAEWPPLLFTPRPHTAARDGAGWRFAFLGIERRFGPSIDWRAEGDGVGQLWRMNLHYFEFLEVLSAADGAEAITQWIAANPLRAPQAHEAAWNPYAVSLRVVCWLQWLARHAADVDESAKSAIARSLAHQAAFLARFPETDIGGNHLIKNVKALAWAAACFDGADARRWRGKAAALLLPELDRQVLSDGVHFERSLSYHCQVAADLVETAAAAPDLRGRLGPVVSRMVAAAQALSHPDGRVAQFNDAGLHMAYRAAELNKARAHFADEPPGPAACTVFPAAGLAAKRTDALSVFVKFGVPGPATLPAHAHGDIGSVELSVGGHRAIVDQGVFEYVEGPLRRASRAAASHNVTAPEGGAMADFFGAFRCGWMPAPRVRAASCYGGRLTIEVAHDGFAAPGAGFDVHRRLVAERSGVTIEDRVTATRPLHGWATRFLLHPDWQALQERGGWRMVGPDGRSLIVECDVPGVVEPAEWWPDMGVRVVTTRLVFPWDRARDAIAIAMRVE